MPKMDPNPIFSILFKKGMADRHRLPLGHVIATLRELEKMVREVGVQVQRDNGVANPDGDFGIELLAGRSGIAFKKGSLGASAAVTRDIPNGILTINAIIDTTDIIEKKRPNHVSQYGEPIFRGLATIAEIQGKDKTNLQLALAENNKASKRAVFSERGAEVVAALGSTEFAVESITVYGKLRRLADYTRDEDEGACFWGELREDSGKEWRIRFRQADLSRVQKLFTKQVVISGNAAHFKTRHPRIDALEISQEEPRDYLRAFNQFRKTYADVFGKEDAATLIKEVKG